MEATLGAGAGALVGAMVGLGTLYGLVWLAFHLATERRLARALARGELIGEPGPTLHPFRLNALAHNPDIDYRYGAFEVPEGAVVRLRGRRAAEGVYFSVVLYDRYLQSVLPRAGVGPTVLNGDDLVEDADGGFTVVLSRAEPRAAGTSAAGNWLDVTDVPEGVVVVRHIGGGAPPMEGLDRPL